VRGDPLLEFEVGVEKLEVVHVVVALVDEVATEGRGGGRQNRLQHWKQKQKEDQNCFTAARVGCRGRLRGEGYRHSLSCLASSSCVLGRLRGCWVGLAIEETGFEELRSVECGAVRLAIREMGRFAKKFICA
jgi:hypothetical protein